MRFSRWAPEWLLAWRDRTLANPSFRQRATRFPLARSVAQRRTGELFDLIAGFVYTQIVLSCVRLRLFDLLSQGPLATVEIADHVGLTQSKIERLLRAASALRLVETRREDRFGLGPLGAVLANNPGLTAMIEHHALVYQDLADPIALLQGKADATHLQRYWAYAVNSEPSNVLSGQVGDYSALMAASMSMIVDDILAAYDFRQHKTVLDVGGGEGAFVQAVLNNTVNTRCILFDLPAVTARAAEKSAGLARLSFASGDFFKDPLPVGADLVTLVRIVHDHDDDAVLVLFRAIAACLQPGGTLLIAEPMSDNLGDSRISDAYFGIYFLAMGSGSTRNPSQLTSMLNVNGFKDIRLHRNAQPLLTRVLTAVKI